MFIIRVYGPDLAPRFERDCSTWPATLALVEALALDLGQDRLTVSLPSGDVLVKIDLTGLDL